MAKSTQTENRYCICIGINDYAPTAGLGPLQYAEADARAMDALLGQRGFSDDHRKLLLGKDATLEAINAALGEIIRNRAGENDLVLFYFAGHSKPIRAEDGESEVFLASYDFDAEKIRTDAFFREDIALGMGRLRSRFFERGRSRQRLFIFDSCYSGDFFGSPYRDATTVQEHIEQVFSTKSPGRIALSSCLPVQKALEQAKYGH
ncbi:MAG TPA: caspase family protein, partial [Ktedonobacteraceae bacterium]|nr:caspase family protein [Ktedonobacteraceae bacterium]